MRGTGVAGEEPSCAAGPYDGVGVCLCAAPHPMVSWYRDKVATGKRDQLWCSGREWGRETQPAHPLRLTYGAVVLSLGLGMSVHRISKAKTKSLSLLR